MTDDLTQEDLERVKLVLDVIAPYVPPRNYEKEAWIAAYAASMTRSRNQEEAENCAAGAVQSFKLAFPS